MSNNKITHIIAFKHKEQDKEQDKEQVKLLIIDTENCIHIFNLDLNGDNTLVFSHTLILNHNNNQLDKSTILSASLMIDDKLISIITDKLYIISFDKLISGDSVTCINSEKETPSSIYFHNDDDKKILFLGYNNGFIDAYGYSYQDSKVVVGQQIHKQQIHKTKITSITYYNNYLVNYVEKMIFQYFLNI